MWANQWLAIVSVFITLSYSSVSVPPSIVERPESQTRPRAGTARFMCQAEGVPPPRISWLKNGEEVHLNGRIKMYNRYYTTGVVVTIAHKTFHPFRFLVYPC